MRCIRYIPQLAGLSLALAASLLASAAQASGSAATGGRGVALAEYEEPLSPLERDMLADAAAARMDQRGLLRAALIASGIDDSRRLAEYLDRVAGWDRPLREAGARPDQLWPTARIVFEFMHRQVLRGGYRQDRNDLLQAIDTGHYNCVSATVLYCSLLARWGVAAHGLAFPGHVMCRASLDGASLDVETTCSRWFRLAAAPQQQQTLLERTLGGPEQYAAKLARRREATIAQLLAMIYYNRGIDLLAARRWEEALAANAKALRLDPENEAARGNLLATLNNWAIALGEAGRYRLAVDRLEAGLALDPGFAPLAANYAHVHYLWVERLCGANEFPEALAAIRRAVDVRPADAYLRNAAADVYRRWSRQSANRTADLTNRGM